MPLNNENENLQGRVPKELLNLLNLQDDDNWDIILVGDGSGSRWGYGGGWASILFDKKTNARKTHWGSLSDTTINICELNPYIFALMWYHRGPAAELRAQKRRDQPNRLPTINVHIVTDCEIIAKQGQRKANREANAALWAAFDVFERQGFRFTFHHIPRDLFTANRVCDILSKDMRHLIEAIEQRLDSHPYPDAYDDQSGLQSSTEE
jgi:hypothetical protein